MTTRISFLCGIISLLTVIFTDHFIQTLFVVVGIIAFLIAYVSHGENELIEKSKQEPQISHQEQILLTPEAVNILKTLASHEQLTSENLLNSVSIPSSEASYWLEELEKQKFIYCAMFPNLIMYSLEPKGYEYLNNNFIGKNRRTNKKGGI